MCGALLFVLCECDLYRCFQPVSSNIRGTHNFQKRKLRGIEPKNAAFWSEKDSSSESITRWKLQWQRKMIFSATAIIAAEELLLYFEDNEGVCIFVKGLIRDSPFLFVNQFMLQRKAVSNVLSLTRLLKDLNVDPTSSNALT